MDKVDSLINEKLLYVSEKCSRYLFMGKEYYTIKMIIKAVYLTQQGHYGTLKECKFGDIFSRAVNLYNSSIKGIYLHLKSEGWTISKIKKSEYRFIVRKVREKNEFKLNIIDSNYARSKFNLIWTFFFNIKPIAGEGLKKKGIHPFYIVTLNSEGKKLAEKWNVEDTNG